MSSSLKLRSLLKHNEEESQGVQPRLPTTLEIWCVTLACTWLFVGLFLDRWTREHASQPESLFTLWSAIFYSGYLATTFSLLLIVWFGKKKKGGTWTANIPEGFGHAIAGAGLFLLGGIGDMLWRAFLKGGTDIEGLLSPPSLLLAVSMCLMVSTGLRVWFRTTPPIGVPRFFRQLPMLLSVVFTTSLLWFMTQFSHFILPRASEPLPVDAMIAGMSQNIAITGYLLHIVIITACILLIARRARIASGGFTFIFAGSVCAMALMSDGQMFLPAAIIAGIVADLSAQKLHPFELHRKEVRAFGFIVPASFFVAYFLSLSLTTGIWWSISLWTSSIFMTGLAGLLTTFLVLPLREWGER